jgi:hypothetical protein
MVINIKEYVLIFNVPAPGDVEWNIKIFYPFLLIYFLKLSSHFQI